MHAIQFARVHYPSTYIIAIAASQHHEKLRAYGANAVFDYKSPTLVEDVRKLGRDIRRGLDCHSEAGSTVLAATCMLPSEAPENLAQEERRRLIRLLPPVMIKGTVPPSVRADEWVLAYTALGKVCYRFAWTLHPGVLFADFMAFANRVAVLVSVQILSCRPGTL